MSTIVYVATARERPLTPPAASMRSRTNRFHPLMPLAARSCASRSPAVSGRHASRVSPKRWRFVCWSSVRGLRGTAYALTYAMPFQEDAIRDFPIVPRNLVPKTLRIFISTPP